jgi:hypothetical protein
VHFKCEFLCYYHSLILIPEPRKSAPSSKS